MLRIEFVKQDMDDKNRGNYKVTVSVNYRIIASGRIKKFDRARGWRGLVQELSELSDLINID